ncbi:MAG: hypothetical protein V1760_03600 [Candidatus Peregrinibacteria bacterium]
MFIRNPYIVSIAVAAVFGWASWLVVINKMSPFLSGYLALGLFYTSLFIALMGTFALLIYYLREWLGNKPAGSYLNTALREGVLLSVMIVVALAFQRLRVLTWWDALLLLAIIFLIEFYMLSSKD